MWCKFVSGNSRNPSAADVDAASVAPAPPSFSVLRLDLGIRYSRGSPDQCSSNSVAGRESVSSSLSLNFSRISSILTSSTVFRYAIGSRLANSRMWLQNDSSPENSRNHDFNMTRPCNCINFRNAGILSDATSTCSKC